MERTTSWMSFPVALNQKLNQCHHKDRKTVLHHSGLPSEPPKTEVIDAFTSPPIATTQPTAGPFVRYLDDYARLACTTPSITLVSLAQRNSSLRKVLLTALVTQCAFKLAQKPMLRP